MSLSNPPKITHIVSRFNYIQNLIETNREKKCALHGK